MKHLNNFTNFLNEKVNDNFLYHTTSIRNLIKILNTNRLNTSGSKEVVSFSRNKNFWFGNIQNNSIRLILDKNKLSTKYKIENFDFYHKHVSYDILTKKTITNYYNKWDTNRKNDYEYEEIINRDISNLGNYISEIEFSDIALGLNNEYKPFNFPQLDGLKIILDDYLLKYPYIKVSIVEIDNKYINGGEINIKNKHSYDKEV